MNGKLAIVLDEALSEAVRINTVWVVSWIEHIDGKDVAILREVETYSVTVFTGTDEHRKTSPSLDPMAESIASQIENCNVEPR